MIGQYGSTTTLIAPNGTGRVAIGTMNPGSVILSLYNTASTQLLDLYGSSTSATGVNQAKSTFLIRQSSTLTGQYSGYDSVVDIWTANPSPAVVANGLSGSVKVSGTTATSGRAHGVMGTAQTNVGTGVQDLAGVYGSAGNLVMGYTQNMSGVRGDVGLLAAATYGTAAAIRGYLTSGTGASAAIAAAGLFEASGSFTNSPAVYGVYIGDMPVAGSSSFGIFQSGADDKNYFAGKVGIGASPGSVALEIYGTGINHSAILIPRDTTALRPAGTNGMLRYNSNTNKFEGFENGTWKDVIQSPRNTISQFEEFMSVPIGAAAATTVVGTALFTSSAGVTLGSVSPASSLEPGIARMTATTTPGNAALAMCGIASAGAVIPNIYLSASPWIFEARVRFSAVNATLSQVRVGMVSASNQYTDNMLSGVFFENQVGTTSAITMAANGSSAQVGSSAAITVSTWYTYKIVWDGSTYSYFSNGNPVTGPTGGSAPAMGTAMCPGVFIVSTGTPSARNVDVDYISFTHQVPGR